MNDLKAFCNSDVNLNTLGDILGLEKSTTGVCRDKHGRSKFGRPSHQNYNPCKCFVHYLDPKEISQCDIEGMISWNEEFLWQPFVPIMIALVFNWVIAIVEFKLPSLLDEVKKIPVFPPVFWGAIGAIALWYGAFTSKPMGDGSSQCGYIGLSVEWLTAICNWDETKKPEVLERENIGKMPGNLKRVHDFLDAGRDTVMKPQFYSSYKTMSYVVAGVMVLRAIYGHFMRDADEKKGYDEIPGGKDDKKFV